MTEYGYVDESGTKDDQEIMTVGLVLFEGQFTARKIQKNVLQNVYPERFVRQHKRDKQKKLGLHFGQPSRSGYSNRRARWSGEIQVRSFG